MVLTEEKRNQLLGQMKNIIGDIVAPGILADYVLTEIKATCDKSDKPYDDAASILFHAAANLLKVGGKIVALGHIERKSDG